MATTGYVSTGAYLDTGYGIARIHGEVSYSWSRTNNTVSFTSTYARVKYVRESGSWSSFNYPGWTWKLYVPSTSHRRTNSGSGTRSVNDTNNGTSNSFSVTVTSTATSVSARIGAYFSGDSETYGNRTLTFDAAGVPEGITITAPTVSTTTATLSTSLTNWGDHCTAGSGQRIEYKRNADGSWTNLAYSTSSSHSRSLTGLISNTRYNMRSYVSNGAGRTGTKTGDFYTKPLAPTIGTPVVEATTATIPTTINIGGGAYTVTKQYRYREAAGTWGAWTTYTDDDIILTGLTPSVDYEVQTRSTTTAGTTEGSVRSLNTISAAKLIMPGGEVVSAVPHVISPEGESTMVKVTLL